MIRRRTRRGIILLAILAAVTWFVSRPRQESLEQPVAELDTRLNYALYDFSGRLLDDQGRIKLEIESPVLRNDAESGIGTVDRPEMRIQQADDRWYITAESAIITADREQVTMIGEVNLTRRNQLTGDRVDIVTRDVLLNVTPRTASTGATVSIRQAGSRLDAVGMKLNMINRSFELLEDVRAYYETP